MRLFSILFSIPFFVYGTLIAQNQEERVTVPLSIAAEMRGFDAGQMHPAESMRFQPMIPAPQRMNPARKSPVLAGALSLILPGAGEVYAGSYLLAGLFAALEGAGWYYSIDANRRGDDATVIYQHYADQNWSVVKYAQWLNENAKNYPGGDKAVHIDINPDKSLPHWQRVNWEQMHTTEMAVPQFSHRLPDYGDQQYYELIGKYNQYSYGWNDKLEGDYWNPSPNFLYYSGLRGDANRYYDRSSAIINLLILNHFLSAIDAAWAAARFNQAVELRSGARLQRLPDGRPDIVTSARFTYRF
ncbi:MAG: hypothetical protein M5R41_09760 [Bacteroidia bacterium]|nr:hypothetical protein [Bacteroidia bacterium]